MGQKPSAHKPKLPLIWILRCQNRTHNPNPEQPIKFQYHKTRRKSIEKDYQKVNSVNQSEGPKGGCSAEQGCRMVKTQGPQIARTKSEPNLAFGEKRHRHRRKSGRSTRTVVQKFGYEIQDIDDFLTK
ncbi:PREDICTED: uncharacterized protein LOC108559805, partial [Nicrophorus vespilloides]|uniref:Uncharacterized protein LOC108559805 n=1 Tax=Nicrophorus vespilloides TaxID=110193 RepID=A0ABM1MDK4_NICVS